MSAISAEENMRTVTLTSIRAFFVLNIKFGFRFCRDIGNPDCTGVAQGVKERDVGVQNGGTAPCSGEERGKKHLERWK